MPKGEKHILVYVARHGTTDLNAEGCFRGPIDAPLDTKGWRDAHQLAHYLEAVDLAGIFHSDKKRTRDTADVIAQHHKGIKVFANSDLRAFNVGDLGGKPKNKENTQIVADHVKHPDQVMPGGESLNNFRRRVQPLIIDAMDLAMEAGEPVLLVAHSSVIREVDNMFGSGRSTALAEPGGAIAIYIQDGKFHVEPVFKPRREQSGFDVS